MRRDLKFVRDLLVHVRDAGDTVELPLQVPGYDGIGRMAEARFLVMLCEDGGFLKVIEMGDERRRVRLTWAGYDKLDELEEMFDGIEGSKEG